MDEAILVTGATGTLGRAVVDRLRQAGAEPRVLSRHAGPGRVVGDLRTGAGIDDAVRGAHVIVHAATGPRGDPVMARTLIDAARRGGADPHLIYVSIVGIDRIPLGYYRQKLAVERLVEASGLPWTIQRATQFHDLLAAMFGALSRSPIVPVLTRTRFQPVDVRDVAARLEQLADHEPAGRVPDLGGPQVRPMDDLAHTWLAATGRRRAVLPVPLPGSLGRAFRRGWNLTPERADGRITFEEYLSGRTMPAGS
jgi:uncharacterized protein YbjT (DUF2867 family)